VKTPWLRAFVFYLAFLWRGLLLFFAVMIPYYLFYGFILLILERYPFVERLVRLTLIVGAMMVAFSWGFQWAMRHAAERLAIVSSGGEREHSAWVAHQHLGDASGAHTKLQ
jgi:hypothetical protein